MEDIYYYYYVLICSVVGSGVFSFFLSFIPPLLSWLLLLLLALFLFRLLGIFFLILLFLCFYFYFSFLWFWFVVVVVLFLGLVHNNHSAVSDFLWPPWIVACHAPLSFTISQSLLKLMYIKLVMPFNLMSSLPSPSPPDFSLFQHQSLFQWVSSLYQVARVLELKLQHQSFQWIFRTDFALVISPYSQRDSQESSSAPQFKSINSSVFIVCP